MADLASDFEIFVESNDNQEIAKILWSGMKQYNASKIGEYERKPFTIYIANHNNDIIGGLKGDVLDKMCAVHTAWVSEKDRKKGWGRKLFAKLEEYAREQQCSIIQLDTTEFQAKPFYEKLGYQVVASLPENFKGHTTYIMRKSVPYT